MIHPLVTADALILLFSHLNPEHPLILCQYQDLQDFRMNRIHPLNNTHLLIL
jgi:hypothetical protein